MGDKFGFHPFLFSLLPILFLYQFNIHEIRADHVVIPLLASVGIVFLIWLVLRRFIGQGKAGLHLSWFLVLLSIHGNIHILLLNQQSGALQFLGKNSVLGPIFLVILIAGIIYIIRSQNVSDKISVANVISITIVGFLSISMLVYFVENPVDLAAAEYFDLPIISSTVETKPDVYVFILDEYAGKDQLRIDFDYDLTDFETELTERGFVFPAKSYSNYPNTANSEPSFMNMQYLDFLTEELGKDSKDLRINHKIKDGNNVMKVFKKNGYKITNFYAGMGATGEALLVDKQNCNYGTINDDLRKNFVNTYIPVSYFNEHFLLTHQWEKLDCTFKTVLNFENDPDRPDYVHVHMKLPHAPYIFDENGNRVSYPHPEHMGISLEKKAYLDQLIFTNKKMLELVDSIQERSPESVIMIFSDHGFRAEIDWVNPENIDYLRGFDVISYFYFPGKDVNLPEELTIVNLYRIFFNEYLDANYELLENKHHWYVSDRPFDFSDAPHDFKYELSTIP